MHANTAQKSAAHLEPAAGHFCAVQVRRRVLGLLGAKLDVGKALELTGFPVAGDAHAVDLAALAERLLQRRADVILALVLVKALRRGAGIGFCQ